MKDMMYLQHSKQLAEKFVDECMRLLKDGKTELQFGKHLIDKYDIDKIKILSRCWTTDANEVQFYNK